MEFIHQSFRSAKEVEDPQKVDKEMNKKGLTPKEAVQFYERVVYRHQLIEHIFLLFSDFPFPFSLSSFSNRPRLECCQGL